MLPQHQREFWIFFFLSRTLAKWYSQPGAYLALPWCGLLQIWWNCAHGTVCVLVHAHSADQLLHLANNTLHFAPRALCTVHCAAHPLRIVHSARCTIRHACAPAVWVSRGVRFSGRAAAQRLLTSKAALEADECDAEAARAARAEALALLGDDAPPPDVCAAVQKLDATLALAAVVEEATQSPDVVLWRVALPEWEDASEQARSVGCARDTALCARVDEAVADAKAAVALEDRLDAVRGAVPQESTTAVEPEQLQALDDVLTAATAARPAVTAALATSLAQATAVRERWAAVQLLRESGVVLPSAGSPAAGAPEGGLPCRPRRCSVLCACVVSCIEGRQGRGKRARAGRKR